MPPRKKASADGAPAAPTRTSARNKAKADAAASAASSSTAVATPTPPTKAAAKAPAKAPAKPKGKRGRAKAADVDEEDEVDQPSTKKAKVDDDAEEDTKQDDAADAAGDAADDAADDSDKKDTKDDDKPKKMVTVIQRGAAPVDPQSDKVDTHQVYSNNESVWDAMLNQTDVSGGANKNKFYVIQLLHPIGKPDNCILYTRWGRVGENGSTQVKGPFSAAVGVGEFKKQFKAKTATNWENRIGMTAKKGKYMYLERDYSNGDDEEEKEEKPKEELIIPDSKLEPEIQEFANLIFSTSIIDAHLSSMNYDARKLPLGKLAKSTILSGFAALKTLAEVMQKPDGDTAKQYGGISNAYAQLSSAYYSIIPHDFGRQRPIIINDQIKLKKELDLVDALGDMEIASKLIKATIPEDENGNPINPLDANFRSLGLTSMDPVTRTSKEFKALDKYVQDTHGFTHRHYSVKIMNAYRVERGAESETFKSKGYADLKNGERLLLWHGSRTTNFAGILSQGLRIAPPEAPVTGYMFGKGVYFADMMSKSANYCYSNLSNGVGVLLLCEVVARPFHELLDSDYHADVGCKNGGKMATKGIGRTAPVDWQDAGEALDNEELIGCQMPAGPGKDVNPPGACLQYNEYIVYDTSQIRVKYLLMVKM